MSYKVECIGGRYDGDIHHFDELPIFIRVSRKHEVDLGEGVLEIDDKEVVKAVSVKATEESGVEYYQQFKMISPDHYLYKHITREEYLKQRGKGSDG